MLPIFVAERKNQLWHICNTKLRARAFNVSVNFEVESLIFLARRMFTTHVTQTDILKLIQSFMKRIYTCYRISEAFFWVLRTVWQNEYTANHSVMGISIFVFWRKVSVQILLVYENIPWSVYFLQSHFIATFKKNETAKLHSNVFFPLRSFRDLYFLTISNNFICTRQWL